MAARAEHANSIASLVSHTLSNAEENLLQGICGEPVAAGRGNDFASPEIDPIAVRARWSRLRNRFVARLPSLEHRDMLGTVADPRRGEITRFEVLMVVARHAVEHLAQAELTRDLYRGR